MDNPYCGGCGQPTRNGMRLARYDGNIWHAWCAITDRCYPALKKAKWN